MVDWRSRTASTASRILCAATLLFVFFLPLHFHFSVAAQVSKACSCVYGARTEMALHDDAPLVVPTPRIAMLIAPKTRIVVSHQTLSQHVRGPPATLSA